MNGFLSGQVAKISKKPVLVRLGMEFAIITIMRFGGSLSVVGLNMERVFVRRVI
jgi:hypothetical protein